MSTNDMHLSFHTEEGGVTLYDARGLSSLESYLNGFKSRDRFREFARVTRLREIGNIIITACDRLELAPTQGRPDATMGNDLETARVNLAAHHVIPISALTERPTTDQTVTDRLGRQAVAGARVYDFDSMTEFARPKNTVTAIPPEVVCPRTPSPAPASSNEDAPLTPPPTVRRPVPALYRSAHSPTTGQLESSTPIALRDAERAGSQLALTQSMYEADTAVVPGHEEERDGRESVLERHGPTTAGTEDEVEESIQPMVDTMRHNVLYTPTDHMQIEEHEDAEDEDEVARDLAYFSDDDLSSVSCLSAHSLQSATTPDVSPIIEVAAVANYQPAPGFAAQLARQTSTTGVQQDHAIPIHAAPPASPEDNHAGQQLPNVRNAASPQTLSLGGPSPPTRPTLEYAGALMIPLDRYFSVDPSPDIAVRPRVMRTRSPAANLGSHVSNSAVPVISAEEPVYPWKQQARRCGPFNRRTASRPLPIPRGSPGPDTTDQPLLHDPIAAPSTQSPNGGTSVHAPGVPSVYLPVANLGQKRSREDDSDEDSDDDGDQRSSKRYRLADLPEKDQYEWYLKLLRWKEDVPSVEGGLKKANLPITEEELQKRDLDHVQYTPNFWDEEFDREHPSSYASNSLGLALGMESAAPTSTRRRYRKVPYQTYRNSQGHLEFVVLPVNDRAEGISDADH